MSILEILQAHTVKRPWSEASRMRCKCGETVTAETECQLYALHRAHVAQLLELHELEAKAAALEETAANLAREADQFATTAERLTGHDNTRYHAYSAARQSIAHQLRDRAAQIKETA